jgi:hypothetical protein
LAEGQVASDLAVIRDSPGVYLLLDLDERPLYVGKSNRLRNRLNQHFLLQNSSATADGLLDVYEVLRVHIWYGAADDLDDMEASLFASFQPRFNRASLRSSPQSRRELPLASDVSIDLIDQATLAARRRQYERIESKLLHLLRGVRKAKFAGASPAVERALLQHIRELESLAVPSRLSDDSLPRT